MIITTTLLAADDGLKKIFGDGVTGAPLGDGSVSEGLTTLFSFGINIVIVLAAIFTLVYMLWGASDYITSAGDAEKMNKARQKIINAGIGVVIIIAVLSLWLLITQNILGIFGGSDGGFEFKIPTLREQTAPDGNGGTGSGGGPKGGTGQGPIIPDIAE